MNRRVFFQSVAGLWLAIQEPVRTYSFLWDRPEESLICEDQCARIVTVGENGDFLTLGAARDWLWRKGGGTALILSGHHEGPYGSYLVARDSVRYEKEIYIS